MAQVTFDCFPGGRRKALVLSCDDGTIHDRRLVDIFNRHGLRGTFHLNSGSLDDEGYLRSSEVGGLFAGHEVAAHSVGHRCLPHLSKAGVVQEIVEDRRALERLTGTVVRGLSYPGCDFNDAVVAMLPALGIEYARTCEDTDSFLLPDDFLRWPISCQQSRGLAKAEIFLELPAQWGLQLLLVMGHSFEFDRGDNWDLIETFGAKIGGRDDIWYATHIEVADYARAMRSVRSSVDGTILYNPSALPVWFSLWEQAPVSTHVIQPGEVLHL